MAKMKAISPIIAIICITAIELVALFKGIDGKLLALAIAAISGLAGYKIRDFFGR